MLKKKREIENFSGHLADNIGQDFYIAMALTNIAADVCGEAQAAAESEQEAKENKHRCQVNVNHAIRVLKGRFVKMMLKENNKKNGEMFNA